LLVRNQNRAKSSNPALTIFSFAGNFFALIFGTKLLQKMDLRQLIGTGNTANLTTENSLSKKLESFRNETVLFCFFAFIPTYINRI
jgi:hypothetical protein